MSFAGHVFDMINRVEQNRKLLRATRERLREVRDAYREAGVIRYEASKPVHKRITEAERQKIRKVLIKARRKEMIRAVAALLVSTLIAVVFLYAVYYFVSVYLGS